LNLPRTSNARLRASVVVPAFNERELIEDVLDRLDRYMETVRQKYDCELIVVDDGSSDGTAAALESWSRAHPGRLRTLTHARNAGLVAAIRTGCAAATGDMIVVMDADLSYSPETIGVMLDAQALHGAAMAIASPYMRGGRTGNVPFSRLAASKLANLLLSACVRGRVKTFTGMVRSYDATALRAVLAEREEGEFNSWIVAQFLARGEAFVEVPAALVWPRSRRREPSRMSWRSFLDRVKLTLVTARVLLRSIAVPSMSNRSQVGPSAHNWDLGAPVKISDNV